MVLIYHLEQLDDDLMKLASLRECIAQRKPSVSKKNLKARLNFAKKKNAKKPNQ